MEMGGYCAGDSGSGSGVLLIPVRNRDVKQEFFRCVLIISYLQSFRTY